MKNNEPQVELFGLVKIHIEKNEPTNIYNIFINDTVFKGIEGQPNIYQKITLNRYFNNLLFRYRSKVNNPVNNIVIFLIQEGTDEDWFKCFTKFVYPFIKQNNVFSIVYN